MSPLLISQIRRTPNGAGFFAWRLAYYGQLLPNTYYAKVVDPWPEAGLRYAACFALEHGTWLVMGVALGGTYTTGLMILAGRYPVDGSLPGDSRVSRSTWAAAREAFRSARDKYLRPYPGVRETLDALRARGLRVVGLTDAPRNAGELRLKHLRLDGHFDALYTLPGYPLPEHVDPEIRRKEEAGHYKSRTPVVELPHDAEKPSAAGLARVLADFGLSGPEVIYVGDNVKKDMPVAEACRALGVWAEYGTYVSHEYRDRLAIISATAVTKRHVADETPQRWPLAISSFTQVLDIVDGARWVPGGSVRPRRGAAGGARPKGERASAGAPRRRSRR